MNTNTHTSPKDFFLHLGATIALYASVIALINLAFEVVNRVLPDALQYYFNVSSIAWPISMLIVLVPILFVLERSIGRDIMKLPEKKDLWIRRWRIYLTLFSTGVTIAVDVIILINTYLNGEISTRFISKVLVVLIISAIVFAYYILAKDRSTRNIAKDLLAIVGIILVLTGIVAGFIIVGSPSKQRAIRFDEQRMIDLNSLGWQITSYWQKTGTLPASLQALNDPISGYIVPMDPETSKPYEYSVNKTSSKSPWTFDLCATFKLSSYGDGATFAGGSLDSQPLKPTSRPIGGGNLGETWAHTAGYNCFERLIDPKLYPPGNSKQ